MYPMGYIFVIKYWGDMMKYHAPPGPQLVWTRQLPYLSPFIFKFYMWICLFGVHNSEKPASKSDNCPKILTKSTKNYVKYDLLPGELIHKTAAEDGNFAEES